MPAGVTASFSPDSVSAGGSSTLTFGVATSTPPGPYSITVTGTASSATHSATVTLTVTAAPNDFSIGANPVSVSAVQGGSATSTISTTVTSGSAEKVGRASSGEPAEAPAAAKPSKTNDGRASTVT